ncbi:pilus assembly protein TadG-related protein [Phenylobacterium sp.]|uniref:pilus assembly protein TadG-related protein n=1 Tax=Phenylobacterium sp. TaxID=1871053 RepID=UPI00273443BC|nr:pilus assembly protein TadG-related protein [Phenylobacterium sp.]MDP3853465.1 pilus assembly protein TadG-related protein [Phenylobacterium sp.]
MDKNSKQDSGRVARLAGFLTGVARRMIRDEGGAAAVFFAVALLLLTPMTLGLVDVYISTTQRGQLQDALDTATLYAARSPAATTAEIDVVGDAALRANLVLPPGESIVSSDFALTGVKVTGSASITPPGISPQIWNQANLTATSEVVRNSNHVEVALVLDTTGSMSGQKLTDMKAAAKELVDIVVQDIQAPYYSKMAIVPYSMAVNVGSYANSVRGTPKSGTNPTTGVNTSPPYSKFKFTRNDGVTLTSTNAWPITTCVTDRIGANAFTDAAPSTTLLGPNYQTSACGSAVIEPLTTNKTTLKNKINSFAANGVTAGELGLAWGWYMVSPDFGYLWPSASRPAAYGTNELVKVVILMTDGEFNTAYCKGVVSKDSSATNNSSKINCNASNGTAFTQAATLCTNMKAKDVVIYTVGFALGNDQNAIDIMTQCATSPKHVYLPGSGAALKDAFKAIGQDINSLRLAK